MRAKVRTMLTKIEKWNPNLINNLEQKEDGLFLNYSETIISQIVEARNNKEFEVICSEIQKFIEENNIDTCFVINKTELIDCLQEHQKLKLQISDLEAKLAEKEEKAERYEKWSEYIENRFLELKQQLEEVEGQYAYECECNKQFVECQNENEKLKQQLAESEESCHKNIVELTKIATEKDRKIEELKQQLAEKEKEIEQLNNRILISQLQAQKEQILNILGSQCIQYNPDQSKTEFAIEKLQRVKKEIERRISIINENYHDDIYDEKEKLDMMHENVKIDDFIDTIIKELEGKSEKPKRND